MFSRNRSTCGVRPYIRATTNPDAESWVARLIAWWIDQETGFAIPERGGVVRWFLRAGEQLVWGDTRAELMEAYPELTRASGPKSLTFVPASVHDNKILLAANPEYLANLMALPLVERERLLGGNWKIKASAGKIFKREWFEIVDSLPLGPHGPEVAEVRFWDFAATKKTFAKADPDFTAGVLQRRVGPVFYISDAIAVQEGPAEVEKLFIATSRADAERARAHGVPYRVRWEEEPGSAGKRESWRLTSLLLGLDALGVPSQGDKITRAKPMAAQAEVGNVKVLRGHWNEMWLEHMHHQPDWPHDDIMDGSDGGFNDLVGGGELVIYKQGIN